MTTRASGAFEVKINPLTAYDGAEGSPLGRLSIDKQFAMMIIIEGGNYSYELDYTLPDSR